MADATCVREQDREEEFFRQIQKHLRHDHDYENSAETDLLDSAPQEVSRIPLSYWFCVTLLSYV